MPNDASEVIVARNEELRLVVFDHPDRCSGSRTDPLDGRRQALGPRDSSFAMKDRYSLVPGSATTRFLLNNTHQRYAALFSYLQYERHTFPFAGLIYRLSSGRIAEVSEDRTHEIALRMCLKAIRRTRFVTENFRKDFNLGERHDRSTFVHATTYHL